MDKKMAYEKKVTLTNFSNDRRNVGKAAMIAKQAAAVNDGLTSLERRNKRLKQAINGCWWVGQYIMGNLSNRNNGQGIDDE